MTRIYAVLATLALLCMIGTMIVGFAVGDLHQDHSAATLQRATVHRLTGLGAALLVVFVNSISVTYFIGTSRWIKEVVETYGLSSDYIRRATVLKRRTFPWAVVAMLAVIGVIALGGAADPATGRPGTEMWVIPHLLGALSGIAFISGAFFVQLLNIQANHRLIDEVVSEVRRLRVARGLEVE